MLKLFKVMLLTILLPILLVISAISVIVIETISMFHLMVFDIKSNWQSYKRITKDIWRKK